jgi:hypothetical protein
LLLRGDCWSSPLNRIMVPLIQSIGDLMLE